MLILTLLGGERSCAALSIPGHHLGHGEQHSTRNAAQVDPAQTSTLDDEGHHRAHHDAHKDSRVAAIMAEHHAKLFNKAQRGTKQGKKDTADQKEHKAERAEKEKNAVMNIECSLCTSSTSSKASSGKTMSGKASTAVCSINWPDDFLKPISYLLAQIVHGVSHGVTLVWDHAAFGANGVAWLLGQGSDVVPSATKLMVDTFMKVGGSAICAAMQKVYTTGMPQTTYDKINTALKTFTMPDEASAAKWFEDVWTAIRTSTPTDFARGAGVTTAVVFLPGGVLYARQVGDAAALMADGTQKVLNTGYTGCVAIVGGICTFGSTVTTGTYNLFTTSR